VHLAKQSQFVMPKQRGRRVQLVGKMMVEPTEVAQRLWQQTHGVRGEQHRLHADGAAATSG
jgi:hypothetical protein